METMVSWDKGPINLGEQKEREEEGERQRQREGERDRDRDRERERDKDRERERETERGREGERQRQREGERDRKRGRKRELFFSSLYSGHPVKVPLPGPAQQVSCGDNHTVVLLCTGEVYTFGKHQVINCYYI